jgi:hypothetical protein
MKLEINNNNIDRNKYIPSTKLEAKEIPSQGLCYPKNFSIKYYPYSFGDVKKISQSHYSILDRYEYILSGIETSFDKLDLTISDLLYIGILRNLSTFGTKRLKVFFTCKDCGHENEKTLELSSLEFQDLSTNIEYPIKIELNNDIFYIKPLTARMFIELYANNLLEDEIAIIAMQSLDFSKDNLEEEFYNNYNKLALCSLVDFEKLKEVNNKLFHGLKETEINCSNCNTVNKVLVDGGDGDVLVTPFRESK